MKPRNDEYITHQRLVQLVNYDPDTGLFTWKHTRGGKRAGMIAGMPRYRKQRILDWNDNGEPVLSEKAVQSIVIKLDGMVYSAAVMAWLYMMGRLPVGTIKRLDGDGANNKWCNLRSRSIYDRWTDVRQPDVPCFL